MKKIHLLLLLCSVWIATLSAQTTADFFRPVAEPAIALRGAAARQDLPKSYNTYRLDLPALESVLQAAPWEFTPAARQHSCTVSMPMADGSIETFAVWQVAIMAPELAAKAPYIHTYGGESLLTPGKTVRFSTSTRGFEAMIMRPDLGVEYVEPYSWSQQEYYLAYDRIARPNDPLRQLATGVIDGATPMLTPNEQPYAPPVDDRGLLVEPVKLRVFRYVAACTGEFADDHGGTAESVLSAVVHYTNLVSATFERDIDMRLQLVGNNDKVIYLDKDTDPYTGLEVGNWMSQNPTVVNSKIGSGNYDLAHVYARYIQGGAIGVAGAIGNTCTPSKAEGCSAGNGTNNYGDGFLNVIGQEVGHQTGGGHTWNRCDGGGGRQGNTAFEPGSGSTIMSYAGSCGADNVQGNSDLYYHAGSIEEIRNYYLTGQGTCGTDITTDNRPPVVTLPYQDGFNIPISTPFELNGSATDDDSDVLTYCWEELDAGPETPLGSPSGNAAIFRTRPAVSVTNRYFPRLNTVLANGSDITEQLPTYTRDLTFRLTARDNRLNGGGVGWSDVAFHAFEGAGPFTVQYPNLSNVTWHVGEYVNVTWDVANTDQSPVNCKKVNIRLSTNGGQGYPVTLASNVDNDGSQIVQVPSNLGPLARVRIDAVDNVFFDVSNQNFKILLPTQPGVSMGLATDGAKICLPNIFSTSVLTAGIAGFTGQIALDIASGLPAGATASFSATTLNPGETSTLNIDLNGVTLEGTYVINVRAIAAGADTIVRPVTLQLTTNDFSQLALLAPVDGATGLGQTQTLHWKNVPDAESYEIQLSTTPSFDTIVYAKSNWTADSLKVPTFLTKGTGYYWRIRPVNECSPHAWTDAFFFSTFVENCQVFMANDLPKNISANGTPTVESTITINAGSTYNSMDIKQIKGNHQFFKELEFHLISPAGTDVLLLGGKCGNFSGNFNFSINDNAPGNFPCPPPNNGGAYKATNSLTPFAGQNSTGAWTLRVKDNTQGSSGQLSGFELEFCSSVSLSPPYIVNNNILVLNPGTNQPISAALLQVDDANNTHAQLVFTLVTVPQNGDLEKNFGGALHPGDQFTQAELDGGAIRYFSYGAAAPDAFRFTVTDNEGGFLATPKFLINAMIVGTHEVTGNGPAFGLFPNPATETVWVALEQPAASSLQVSLFNLNGQLIQQAALATGSDRLAIPVNTLPKGLYMVRLESATGAAVRKLVVE